jgi:tRNA1(Val) A37 N6-methylase TrmN6
MVPRLAMSSSFMACSNLLNETGSCFIVIPAHNFMLLQTIAAQNKLFVNECMSV